MGVAWKSFSERGALIEIAFPDAAGVVAGQTEVKYRDVAIGRVEKVAFSDDLSEVIVSARVEKDLMAYLDEDARFWVVRPEVSVRGITGLDTVLSGVFIEGSWDTNAGEARTRFVADSGAPLSRRASPVAT
ncbi:MAG: MlaD family protein [Paracoccaceae bacterium]